MKPLDQTRLEAALRAVEAAGEVTENTIRRAITAYTATLPGGEPPGCPTPGACSCTSGDVADVSRKINAETERLRTRYHEAIAKAIDKIEAADNMTAAAEARALAAERERDDARRATANVEEALAEALRERDELDSRYREAEIDFSAAAKERNEAREALATERAAIEAETRRYAGHYPQSSDGRNSFTMLADWISSRAAARTDIAREQEPPHV